MNHPSFRTAGAWVPALLCMAAAVHILPAQTSTVTIQNGANGYTGAKDVSINTQYAQYNGGNGTQWRNVPQLACYTTTGTGSYTVRYLLKFNGLPIPSGQRVASASLTLTFESWNPGPGNLTGYYVRNIWDPAAANLGWLHRNATQDWAAPGASAAGTDTVAGKSFQAPALKPTGIQTVTIPLDPAVVQSWIDTPSANQGILLVNNNPGEIIRIMSTSATTQAQRPKLTVSLSGSTPAAVQVSVAPSTATLQPGQTRQFTATVTGSTNTAVTWTSTGGSITSAGLFTAGSTAGAFTVKATSAADTSKSATAAVTIQQPPASVSVSISPTSASLQPGQTRQFTATVSGSTNTAVTWTATGGSITSAGLFTAGSTAGTFTVKATSAADTSKSATAAVTVQQPPPPPPSSGLPPVPRMSDGAYVVVQTPVSGMHFSAPATIRIYADPYDPAASDPDAITVTFLLDGQSLGAYSGSSAQNGYFAITASNIPAGAHTITAQITAQGRFVQSAPITVYVDSPVPSSGPVYNLTADVVLSGSQNAVYAGTAANRCTILGNGFQIRSASGFTGSLTISNCDIHGLGRATTPSINVTTGGSTGAVQLSGNTWETSGTVSISVNDQAQANIRNNEFRANMAIPVTSLPIEYSNATLPVFRATGNSTAQKYFQGNNVGLSTVAFDNTTKWLIGGSTDAESNVLMGVRCGFTITRSSNMVLRGNYSQHNYPHRFSQGENFELQGDGFLAEHNVIRSSSWPVRGIGGELRYNLIDASGNSDQVLQGPRSNARIHHNIFVFTVSQTLYSPGTGFNAYGAVDQIQFYNNVMDGGGSFMAFYGNPFSVLSGAIVGSLRNNVFFNFATQIGSPAVSGALGESTNPPPQRLRYADYNAFYNPNAANPSSYGIGVIGLSPGVSGYGLHDLGGFNRQVNPQFKQPTAIPFPFAPQDIWTRSKRVSDVLATYRAMYSPNTGSPLLGAGDPQDGQGGNIGAVGNGEASDLFGKFGQISAPPPPTISGFTASPASIAQGQSTTLSWSATNADTLQISPAPGIVTSSPVTVTPAATTTYVLTATNSSGSATASVTVTVTPASTISVTIAPSAVTLAPGASQTFTATVNGTQNTGVSWSATGGTISAAGLYTAGTAEGTFTVTARSVQDTTRTASATVSIFNQQPGAARPRIILDSTMLSTLRSRAQARTTEWTKLKSVCDSYIGGGSVYYPGENGYPNRPSVGEGYQGSGYIDALMPLGVCYHSTLLSDAALASQYGAKAVAILMAMSDPNHSIVDGRPVWLRDYGYGIRNFGVAMGIGYDWFHALLDAAQKSQLQTALDNWFAGFENDSFEYDHPQGNYFAGYYAAKCMAALAVEGDSPLGDAWWDDWYNHQHLQRVAPYYALNLAGGGWTEGFTQYGVLATRNQSLPLLAVKTAKGIDLTQGPVPYTFPLDQARYLMAFTWPTRDMFDDRGELYDTGSTTVWPGTARLETYRFLAGFLRIWNDPLAPVLHKYARDVKSALDVLRAGDSPEWLDFLFWDETYAGTPDDSSLAMSYLAPGVGGVAARSDWSTSATFLTMLASPYINFPSAGHEAFDKGSIAIQRNRNPLVVNPPAWLTHEPYGSPGWTAGFDDRFGNWSVNHTLGNRTFYNTFQVRHLDALGGILSPYGQWAMERSDGARTGITRFEDAGAYVLATAQYLEDMYRPLSSICQGRSPLNSWSRQIVYLRPSQFVVYDRTEVCDPSLDQYLAYHFPANPSEVAVSGSGVRRFDVNTGQFAGSMSTVLPAGAAVVTTDRMSAADSRTWNKVWRSEIRATGAAQANRRWLTVFDLAPTSGQVASASPVNILSGAAVGVHLQAASGNSVVISGTQRAETAITGTLQYSTTAAPATLSTRHVLTDLAPSSGYGISVAVQNGGNQVVTVIPGGSTKTSSVNGVISFLVDSSGQLILQP